MSVNKQTRRKERERARTTKRTTQTLIQSHTCNNTKIKTTSLYKIHTLVKQIHYRVKTMCTYINKKISV